MRCLFENYDSEQATRDTLQFQTSDNKLQIEILTKDLDMEAAIKAGLALEQSKLKQEGLNSGRKLDNDV